MINNISNTIFIGKVFHHFDELASTNQYAIDLLSKNKPSAGTVISTYNQRQGRGQIGRFWESEPEKNISVSIILYPHFLAANRQFLLSQVIALAVHDFLAKYISKDLTVKWPNDIYVKRRKIAGILLQNTLQGTSIASTVVGIGININQAVFKSDAPNPTSLYLETQQNYDLDALLMLLCQTVEQRYLQLQRQDYAGIAKDYYNYLYQFGVVADYQRADGDLLKGKILGIDEIGRLKIETSVGVEIFDLKEIRFL
ncbi:MAG: biotin--[acetyl-CoA-carboxylase] ligase [Saprospiraceae bacterium]